MSEISIGLTWKLGDGKMTPNSYSNVHEIVFTSKNKITADSAPDWRGNEINCNPEQTLAASLSSCHLMTFCTVTYLIFSFLFYHAHTDVFETVVYPVSAGVHLLLFANAAPGHPRRIV